MALTTLDDVKTFLGITSTAEDTKLSAYIVQVNQLILSELGFNPEQATYTDELHDLESGGRIVVRNRPLVSITSIYLDFQRVFASTSLLTSTDYYLGRLKTGTVYLKAYDRCRIQIRAAGRLSGTWDRYIDVVKVTYVGGYTVVPADLMLLANMMVALLRQIGPKGGLVTISESLKIYSYSLGKGEYGAEKSRYVDILSINGILANYRLKGRRIN